MIKIFKLNTIEEQQFTASEGKMTFHLMDENGDERAVWGSTQLDETGHAISITANKKREHPLIQCLFTSEPNDEIEIEFTQYNNIITRDDSEVSVPNINELMKDMQTKAVRLGPMIMAE